MKTTTTIFQMVVRITGLIEIVLGVLFWTGNSLALVQVHMLVGLLLVLSLWTIAGLAARSGVSPGLVILAVVWGLIVPILGMTQTQILPGSAHWIVQVAHLLIGLGAIGLAESLARQIKRRGSSDGRPIHQPGGA